MSLQVMPSFHLRNASEFLQERSLHLVLILVIDGTVQKTSPLGLGSTCNLILAGILPFPVAAYSDI
jgi:hypothetical protein